MGPCRLGAGQHSLRSPACNAELRRSGTQGVTSTLSIPCACIMTHPRHAQAPCLPPARGRVAAVFTGIPLAAPHTVHAPFGRLTACPCLRRCFQPPWTTPCPGCRSPQEGVWHPRIACEATQRALSGRGGLRDCVYMRKTRIHPSMSHAGAGKPPPPRGAGPPPSHTANWVQLLPLPPLSVNPLLALLLHTHVQYTTFTASCSALHAARKTTVAGRLRAWRHGTDIWAPPGCPGRCSNGFSAWTCLTRSRTPRGKEEGGRAAPAHCPGSAKCRGMGPLHARPHVCA